MFWVLTRIYVNPYWKALDNLDVVTTGAFGRKETEERARSAGHVLDGAAKVSTQTIDMDRDGFAWVHAAELCFFEVRCDPDVVDRNDREQCLAGLNAISNLDGLVSDDAANGSVNGGVAEVQFCHPNIGAGLFERTVGRGGLSTGVGYLLWSSLGGGDFSLALRDGPLGFGNPSRCSGLRSLIG